MTPTERLRELLDERGVEWAGGIARPELTQVRIDGKVVKFHPWQPNTLKVSLFDITPEQAIAATLGSSNCTNSERSSERTTTVDETDMLECICDQVGRYGMRVTIYVMECSACGHTYEHINGSYEFCPRCGRKVVDDD